MLKISLSMIIDKKYIEPALVTLFTLLKYQSYYKSLKLIILKKENDSIQNLQEIINLFNEFKSLFDEKNFIEIIIIENKFPEFNKLHFSNAILYKIFTPIIVEADDYILNVDAGNLFHDGFFEFSKNLNLIVEHKNKFIMGAFLMPSKMEMPSQISNFSVYYPAGGLILFNVNNYKENKIDDKIIEFYNYNSMYLKYAEQEIMCAILDDSQFYEFKGVENIYLDDLSLYIGSGHLSIDYKRLNSSIYYKNTGSIKPWKNWNLNPNRSIYLKIRSNITKFINLNQYTFIMEERQDIAEALIPFKQANLLAYENELIERK